MSDTLSRYAWIDCLRSTLTILVVGHHSALAYTTFAIFVPARYIDSTHPIVDTHRSLGLDIFQNFNDIFFMSLMFFIGGLFLHRSILKKRFVNFVLDRFYRLFLPFIFIGTILMLLAHIPAYYSAHRTFSITYYVVDYFSHESWPVGPPWFIWVLFVFNLIFALFNRWFRKLAFSDPGLRKLAKKPLVVISLLIFITWVLYVPAAILVGPGKWIGFGPFDFQLSRILLYFGYFIMGVQIGYSDINSNIFNKLSPLVSRWKLLVLSAAITYGLLTIISTHHILEQLVTNGVISETVAWMTYFLLFVTSCSLSCLAFICFFRAKMEVKNFFWVSLSQNAYLIYLIHYVFVIWIQFGLNGIEMPAFFKFIIVFICSLSLSWVTSIALRKINFFARYL